MPTYLHPGVYVEEIPSGSKPIEGVATSVASFIGFTTQGEVGEPILINKWDDYDRLYGGIRDTGQDAEGDYMGHAVFSFFQNGGTKAYVVRVTKGWADNTVAAGDRATKAVGYLDHPEAANVTHAVEFTAVNEGAWANGMVAKVTVSPVDASLYAVQIGWKDEDDHFTAEEQFSNVSFDSADGAYIEGVINGVSDMVTVKLVAVGDMEVPDEFFLGTSTSDDLTGADLDLSAANEGARTLTLALDGNPAIDLIIDAADYTGDLDSLASTIEAQVRSGGVAARRTNFTCEVAEQRSLVLTSGSRVAGSSVVVANSGVAPTLLLGVANGGTEATGQASADASWSSRSESSPLAGGTDGADDPTKADYQAVFTRFLKFRDINIICVPGQYWDKDGAGNDVISAAISHAEAMKSRMVIVDPDPDSTNELTTELQVSTMALPTSTYSVLYYPWLKVNNPHYDVDRAPAAPKTVWVPPCGVAAGMWSKTDGRRGVWKAPAGVETGLLGVSGLQFKVEDPEQDVLNPLGVNCIRALPNFGSVIWGSRTLATKANPEWRYVPVRRTAIMIEQSIYNGIQWAVFEPNDHRLWSALRTNIDAFMNGLFRAGAFQGRKASDAYFVRCGLGDTMTQGDIDRGQVIVIVGFAPLKPAEFVIVRIQQKVGQQ